MPDLRQALKDFVATSNSGIYQDEETLLSKFPELKGYNINVLKDFVATSNSGVYTDEEQLFSKFPEFGIIVEPPSKKKVGTVSPSAVGSSVSPKKVEEQGWLLNTVSALDKGFAKNFIGNPVKGLGTLLQGATAKITGGSGKAFISDALINFGDYFNKTIDELTPQDEAYKNSLSDQFGQAFGQVASLIATGGATGAASKGATLASQAGNIAKAASVTGKGAAATAAAKNLATQLSAPTSISAGLSMGQSEFDRAKEAGATDDQAFEAFYKNAAVGSVLETIPVMQFLKRFEKASEGGIKSYLKTKGVAGLTGGVEEMTTEVMQQIYANKSAQEIYNTNQDLFEGVGSSGGVGFGVGFLLNAMGANAKLLRQEGKNDEADMVEGQIKEFENQVQKGGPSSYKLNGIKIEPVMKPDGTMEEPSVVIGNLIDKMDANDLAKANIDIINDPELKIKLQDKIISSSIREQVRQGNPDLNEASLNAITELELQLRKLEGNTTQTGKDKAAAIRAQIKNIQENQIEEEAKVATVEAEAPEVTKKRADRIAELEAALSPDSTVVIEETEREKLQTELETLKTEQDAIQKQATDESVLRAGEPQVGLPKVGEGDEGPQVITEGTQKTITTEDGTQKVEPIVTEPVAEPTEQEIVDSIVADQTEESANEGYEYADLYNRDPRLAALESQKDMLKFTSGQDYIDALVNLGETQESAIERQNRAVQGYTRNINALENSLKATPAAEPTIEPAATPAAEPIAEPTTQPIEEPVNTEPTTVEPLEEPTTVEPITQEPKPKTTIGRRAAAPSTSSTLTKNAMKSFKSIFPNVPVKTFKNMKEMRAFVRKELGDKVARGLVDVKGVLFSNRNIFGKQPRFILLNEEMRSPTTLPHEIWHALLAKSFGGNNDNKALFRKFRKSIENTFRKNGYNELADKLSDFADQPYYKRRGESAEEWLVQLGAYMTESGFKVRELNEKQKTVLGQLKEIINKYAIKLFNTPVFLEEATPENVLEFITTISDSLRRGEDLNKYFKESKLATATTAEINDIMNADVADDFESTIGNIKDIIAVGKQKKTDIDILTAKAIRYLTNSDAYKNADDIQKEQMYREVRDILGLKQKSAPSVTRLKSDTTPIEGKPTFDSFFGKVKKGEKVTMTEKQAFYKQIKDLARGAKDAKAAWVKISDELSKGIKELTSRGTITDTQAKNVIRKFSKVNMFSQKSINSFIDYMTNVFANAEYSSKLSQANSLKKDIAKLSRNKEKDANLRDMAQQFVKIDPSMVDDIDAYNDMASKIKEAVKGSTIRGEDVKFADTVNIENASEYINKTLDAQDEKIRQQKIEEIQELMGVDVSELSYDDMIELLDKKKTITKYNEGIIRSTIQKMFDIYSSIINETINTGVDQFNGEDVSFTDSQKKLVRSFMDMDLTMLSPKEALQAVDALSNFLENQSTAKMQSVVSNYEGIAGAQEIAKSGIKASPLKKYNMEWLGKLLGEQLTNLNILFERMFKGFRVSGKVMDKMGFTELVNKKAFSERQSNNIVDKYVEQFYKKEANGEAYNSEYNNTERGLASFMMRNVIGTAKEMKEEFNRRKDLIKESIEVLSEGNEQEKKKAELYKRVYDKVLKNADSIQDVKKNTDKTNMEGVEYWMNEWSDKYEQLADVSMNVYNKVLDKDLNYTPDRFAKLSSDTGVVELGNDESAFHSNNGTIYSKETGVLMTAQKPKNLPTNPENGDTNRYVDLSFDNNNSNSMYDALVDINTAAPIRQIQGFLNSTFFKKIVPDASNAKILKDRIDLYVRNIRNKNPYSTDQLDTAIKKLNKIAAIGVGQALGGPTQVIKQVIPVAMNTIVNAGGLDVLATFNEDKDNFINNSGYAIANRGAESQSQVQSINRLVEEAAKSKGEKLFKAIEKANEFWLKKFLVNADVYIAKASWLTYYEQELKRLGLYNTTIVDKNTPSGNIQVSTPGIDYKTHKLNKEAANYAQRMVDRQQNVSDSDLAGKLFASKDSKTQAFVKGIMPFASFRMNQSARLGSDLATLMNKTSTEEDKKIAAKSLSGYAVEAAMFRMIGIGIATLLATAVKKAMGVEEADEEKKKRMDNLIKGARTGTVTDLVSPLPLADKFVQMGASAFLNKIEKETNLPVSIYGASKQDVIQSAGLFGIAAERLLQTVDISKLAATGKYTDDFGKEKTISEQKRRALGMFVAPAILSNLGLLPTEVNSAVRYAVKDAKSKSKTTQEIFESQAKEEEKQLEVEQKSEALEKLRQRTRSQAELDVIDEKIDELDATPEEKKLMKAENKEEKELKNELLTDPETGEKYDNETELKRYNPRLYNKNFGPRSEWFKDHKAEKEVQKKLNKEIRKIEDKKYKYARRNSDGSLKRTGN